MQSFLASLRETWPTYIIPIVVFLVVLLLGWSLKRLIFRGLESWSARSKGKFDDMVLDALRRPFMLWVLILALYLATQLSDLPPRAAQVSGNILLILWIASLTFGAARLAGSMVKYYGHSASSALPVTTLTQNLVSMTVGTIGVLILLDTLHISITPVLTALGVGGIAVALALQDTLSNLFAGFYVTIAGQIRVGDYIKLDTGNEGYVRDISWRSATLHALPNNTIVIPNAKLAQVIVTNFDLPDKSTALSVLVRVSYESDIDRVEEILKEIAIAGTKDIPGMLADPAPGVSLIPGFSEWSVDFTVGCQVAEFVNQYSVQHELRKRIFKRFREEGIRIPYPVHTVHLEDHTAAGGGNGMGRPENQEARNMPVPTSYGKARSARAGGNGYS
jgi:small-conductance mechanosensitive channel